MPSQSFFALCKTAEQQEIKRLSLDAATQSKLEQLFTNQESDLRSSMEEEVAFVGDYNCDADEILVVDIPDQIAPLREAIQANSLSLTSFNPANILEQNIKAIFTGREAEGNTIITMQGFSSKQVLEHKFSLVLKGDILNELTDPVFTLDNKLVGIIEGDTLKFKKFHNIKRVFDLTDLYREATDEDIDQFAGHSVLDIENLDNFKGVVCQTSRKLVHAIQRNNILDNHTADVIHQKAQSVEVTINIENGCVKMPTTRAEIKRLLQFLHDDIFEAPLSGQRYITNSKKAA